MDFQWILEVPDSIDIDQFDEGRHAGKGYGGEDQVIRRSEAGQA